MALLGHRVFIMMLLLVTTRYNSPGANVAAVEAWYLPGTLVTWMVLSSCSHWLLK